MSDLTTLSVHEARARAADGSIRPAELVRACLERIERQDPRFGAFLGVEAEWALERAAELERQRQEGGEPGPLYGVPFGLKDNLALSGWPLTCASRILDGFRSSYTATCVQRLLDAGAIPIGRCNMDEFAFGSSSENSAWQTTRNPWDPERIPGGSSGGSAAAVAARLVPFALGSDTGGSIRQPAALCGVTGMKPTYGRVSRFGLVAFGSSLDQVGPLTRSAADARLVLSVLAGRDPRDATTVPAPFRADPAAARLDGLRVGCLAMDDGIEADVRERVAAATEVLQELGAELRPIELPHAAHAIPTYYLVATSEASSNLARFDGVRYGPRQPSDSLLEHYLATRGQGFGAEAKRRILLGVFCLSAGYYDAYYRKALQVRTLLRQDFARAFESVDVILGPTSPFAPYRIGESADDPLKLYVCDQLTTPANLAGLPAISVPCGTDANGLPVGLQLQGPALGDARVLRVAEAFQQATSFHEATPPEVA